MQSQPEVKIAALSFIVFWLVTLLAILIAGRYHPTIGGFKNRAVSKWKPALIVAGIYVLGSGIGGRGFMKQRCWHIL